MKILIAPDSFKGTMTSSEVCRTVKAAIKEVIPSAEITSLPVADGGEGSVDAFAAALSGKARIVLSLGFGALRHGRHEDMRFRRYRGHRDLSVRGLAGDPP